MGGLCLAVLDDSLAVCRLETASGLPSWATSKGFFSVTRTEDELSVVCPQGCVPDGVSCEGGWRALRLEGPFEFSEVGVLASVAAPLAEEGVSIFALSTFDTDYVLVKDVQLRAAIVALSGAGHEVRDVGEARVMRADPVSPRTTNDAPRDGA